MMKAPLGYFDANASGLIRGRLDAAAADTETLLAHNTRSRVWDCGFVRSDDHPYVCL